MTKNHFRLLLSAQILLYTIAICVEAFYPSDFVEEVNYYITDYQPVVAQWQSTLQLILSFIGLPIILASYAGLFLFKNWGRPLFVASLIITVPLYFIDSVYVAGGLAQFAYDSAMLVTGMVLVLIYYSPITLWFEEDYHSRPRATE